MRKAGIITFAITLLLVIQCQTKIDADFLIGENRVGKLTRSTRVQELETIFVGDSVVMDSTNGTFGNRNRRIEIFEKGGNPLLTLTPKADSLEIIRILDPRFMTPEGIGIKSTFKDIQENYAIRKIVTSMNNVVIFLKGKDFYFTISREELPASLRYMSDITIDEVQIPDKAKIKYMMVGWED